MFLTFPSEEFFYRGRRWRGAGCEEKGGRWVLGEGRKNTVNAPVTFALLILDKTALLMSDC